MHERRRGDRLDEKLITVAKYYPEWSDRRFVVGVLNNQDLNQVTWELRAMAGSPDVPFAQHIPDFPYAGFAESIGLAGIKVTDPGQVRGVWERALSADRPCVVEFVTDPNVPPIPPHASLDQMESTAQALLRGDPEAWDVVKTGVKAKAQDFLPGR